MSDAEQQELGRLRNKQKRLIELKAQRDQRDQPGQEEHKSDDDSIVTDTVRKSRFHFQESDEDSDTPLPAPIPKKAADRKPRQSISAEAFGDWNKKGNFNPPVHQKEDSLKEKIRKLLSNIFMFKCLGDEEFEIVIMAMKQISVVPGEFVIKEGDDGNCLYVTESGILDCTKTFAGNDQPTFLKVYNPGEVFGELALLYNVPRAANIIASTDAVLFSLDRDTFSHIVKDAAMNRRNMYDEFLKKVALLSQMDNYERVTISDAFVQKKWKRGDHVINEGEIGDDFYFVVKGECVAVKTIDGKKVEVMQYKEQDYFGERALIKNEPRAATIVVQSETCETVSLDKDCFSRTLGSIEDMFKRNMEIYLKYQ